MRYGKKSMKYEIVHVVKYYIYIIPFLFKNKRKERTVSIPTILCLYVGVTYIYMNYYYTYKYSA